MEEATVAHIGSAALQRVGTSQVDQCDKGLVPSTALQRVGTSQADQCDRGLVTHTEAGKTPSRSRALQKVPSWVGSERRQGGHCAVRPRGVEGA